MIKIHTRGDINLKEIVTMDYDLTNLWIVYIASFVLTWTVGLSVPLLIRYVFMKRAINKASAIAIVILLLFLQLALWISLGSTNKSHAVLVLIAYVSYYILRKQEKTENGDIKNQTEKISHNNPKSKKAFWIIILLIIVVGIGILFSMLIYKQKLLIENLTLPTSSKDSSNFEQIGNLYRNIKYNFRFKFPEGWEIKPADGLHILQKAISGNSTISVGVIEIPASLIDETATIKDLMTLSEFKDSFMEDMEERLPGAILLNYGETKLDDLPTYWVKYSAPYSMLDNNIEFTMLLYQLIHKNILYSISAGGLSSEFTAMKQEFKKSISTFMIENH